ncbi:hypothetical protein LWI28_008522 [Acer negundo]|uniref:Uncharacterized protein n=1 Tax=Acer negundo TaxID=4023 RepID=A0AAD5J4Y5_ACENE|nr:hypothetical protein LWI28_008522 [Acer negundo]
MSSPLPLENLSGEIVGFPKAGSWDLNLKGNTGRLVRGVKVCPSLPYCDLKDTVGVTGRVEAGAVFYGIVAGIFASLAERTVNLSPSGIALALYLVWARWNQGRESRRRRVADTDGADTLGVDKVNGETGETFRAGGGRGIYTESWGPNPTSTLTS